MKRYSSMRGKLTALIAGGGVVTALIAAAGFAWLDVARVWQGTYAQVAAIASIVADQVEPAIALGDRKAAAGILNSLRADRAVHDAVLYDARGACFARMNSPSEDCPPLPPDGSREQRNSVVLAHPITADGERQGTLVLAAGLPSVVAVLRQYLGGAALIVLLSLSVAAVLAMVLQSRVSAPILAMAQVAENISQTHRFQDRVAVTSNDELGVLAASFNSMLNEIAGRDAKLAAEIAERQCVNVELRTAKTAAECASRAKSEFLANVSHEIRTPMNGVLGMTELALQTDLTPEQRGYLTATKSSAEALLTVINDVLDFSKIEAGKLQLENIGFDLLGDLSEALKLLSLRADEKGLELVCDLDADVPGQLVGDPGRFRQVIINLAGNAIKFTERGEVVVHVAVESRAGDRVLLHVRITDTGIGISEDTKSAIFQPFTQADGTTTRKYGGTGLGLSISRQIVELMQGKIWVESTVGRGSTFHFTASFGAGLPSAAAGPDNHAQKLEGLRVLIVDDNLSNRTFLGRCCARWGMLPTLADGAASALRALEPPAQPFDLALLDVCMPETDGPHLHDWLRARPDFGGTKTVFLGSAARRRDVARALQGGAVFLTKPVGPKEMREAIEAVLFGNGKVQESGVHTNESDAGGLRSLRILMAEDSPINQEVAVGLLGRRGHSVHVVENGRQAILALAEGGFDLVLMDIQMPEMGGVEATAAIRAGESASGAHIPIVALTAHALAGDREVFLNAGMDGYVSKPLRINELLAAMRAVLPGGGGTANPEVRVVQPVPAILDREELLASMGGDRGLLCRITSMFLAETPKKLTGIRAAIDSGDTARLARLAHALKGSVGNFYSATATAAALRLETIARQADLSSAPRAYEELAKAIGQMTPELEILAADDATAGAASQAGSTATK